jgi:hypothetical protein
MFKDINDVYENRRMKSDEIVLRREQGRRGSRVNI